MKNKSLYTLRRAFFHEIRNFFDSRDFLEVETPLLVPSPGMEATLDAFQTEFIPAMGRGDTRRLYLPTSPEFHMKRLLASGFQNIYQISRAFRNGEIGRLHNPEFTLLEWYRAGAGYEAIMRDVEALVHQLFSALQNAGISPGGGTAPDTTPPWERLTVNAAWRKYAGIDLARAATAGALREAGLRAGVHNLGEDDSWETLYFKIFLHRIEPRLGAEKPLILYEYPASMAALSRTKPDDPRVCLRFEVYIAGIELANAFDELTDSRELRRRWEAANREKRREGRPPFPVDEGFLAAVDAMPAAAGIALGLDRLLMLLAGKETIHDVIPFSFREPGPWG